MLDREQVIAELEYYRKRYNSDGELCDGETIVDVQASVLDSAVALLEAQVPIKHGVRKGVNGFSIVWTCGNCGADLQPNNRAASFCYKCGREVKWCD